MHSSYGAPVEHKPIGLLEDIDISSPLRVVVVSHGDRDSVVNSVAHPC
jgi:hypothetical protein